MIPNPALRSKRLSEKVEHYPFIMQCQKISLVYADMLTIGSTVLRVHQQSYCKAASLIVPIPQ